MAELKAWRVLREETLLDVSPWMRVVRQSVALPGGASIDGYLVSFERDFVMIAAIDDVGTVLVVRQYKHGMAGVLNEFPAGYIDEGETPLEAARRELLEETGYEAASWTPLGEFHVSPTRGPARAHFFLARDLARTHEPKLDPTEVLTSSRMPSREIDGLLAASDMPSLANAALWGLATAYLRGEEQ